MRDAEDGEECKKSRLGFVVAQWLSFTVTTSRPFHLMQSCIELVHQFSRNEIDDISYREVVRVEVNGIAFEHFEGREFMEPENIRPRVQNELVISKLMSFLPVKRSRFLFVDVCSHQMVAVEAPPSGTRKLSMRLPARTHLVFWWRWLG